MASHGSHDSGGGSGGDYTSFLLLMLLVVTFVFFVGKLTNKPLKDEDTSPSVKHVFPTAIAPRSEVIFYTTQNGDTIEAISKAFSITQATIRRVNNISDDAEVEPGTKLTILPTSGYMHTVVAGETIYTIADKYKIDPMNIVNYPFNSFKNPGTFELEPGQTLIVPE